MRRAYPLSQVGRMLLAAAVAGVCLAQPGIPDRNAKVIVQQGRVSVIGDSGEQALFVNSLVQPRQMIVTGPDGYAQFQVSDGSTFEVFPGSRLVFRPHVASWEDLLDITLGRVKVFIQHLNGVPNPNRVSSPTAIISVRGTVFDVLVEDPDGTTVVSVDEGLVYVRNIMAGGNVVPLHPGQGIRVYPNQPLAMGGMDRGGAIYRFLKGLEEAAYQIGIRRGPGGGVGLPGSGGASTGTANGDKGKGGGTTAPGSPGTTGTTAPTAPGAPSAPGPPH